MKHLTNPAQLEESSRQLRELLASRGEWLCAEASGARSPRACAVRAASGAGGVPACESLVLRAGEWDVCASGGALRFSFLAGAGWRLWRVAGWEWTGATLSVSVSRRAGALSATLVLTPLASARDATRAVREARLAECGRLAAAACARVEGASVESVRLSAGARRREPGRYARILLRRGGRRVAVTGAVVPVKAHETDALLASALQWWTRLDARGPARAHAPKATSRRARDAAGGTELWLVAARESAAAPGRRFHARSELSETAARLSALAPAEIDVVRARHGETLRFRGLAFARVRRLLGRERVWFGPPGAGQKLLLGEENWPRLAKLIDELAEHRRAGAADARHAFYRAAPEAWLESILRRDISRLDPGLVVSPLHAQFRASRDGGGARPVDLLALRRDGRLVVIELKVSEDAALPLQGADYWRRVSAYHRAGHVTRARLFGDAEISDDAPLVYLVAPGLRFHRSLQTLARCLTPEIGMYRFDLNEDWRAGVRVARRARVN
ncbi:MAG: hypothetical protein LC800_22740 [Acidobacteria bacterium]|nr:hypothetical protein [Acidobacteriota bacterium]